MKKNILKIFLIILICFWLATVFGLSNDNAEKSSGLSLKIAKIFSNDENVLKKLEPVIRKLAHLTEYMIGRNFVLWAIFNI